MTTTALGGTLTQVDTIAQYPLGHKVLRAATATGSRANRGEQLWIYVQNNTAVDWAACNVLMRDLTEVTYRCELSDQAVITNPDTVVGVAQHAVPAASFAFVLREGVGNVLADTGGLTASSGLVIGDAVDGTADNAASATAPVFGYVITAALATALAVCKLSCKG